MLDPFSRVQHSKKKAYISWTYFRCHGTYSILDITLRRIETHTLPCLSLLSGPNAVQCLHCTVLLKWRVFLFAYTFKRHIVLGPLFLREDRPWLLSVFCFKVARVLPKAMPYYCGLRSYSNLVVFCGHTGTTVTSLFPFIIPTATFLHIHLSPPVRFVIDVITTSTLDLGCTSDLLLGFAGRK
jgi:hypothetical protein